MKTKLSEAEKLQKAAAGSALWREIQGNCTGPLSEFRSELEWVVEHNRYVRDHSDAAGRRAEKLASTAETVLAQIEDLPDDHVGFGAKFPRTPWEKCQARFLTATEAVSNIESTYGPGYTSEPYVQLIQITTAGKSVVAEWAQGQWLGALEAAGFAPRSV